MQLPEQSPEQVPEHVWRHPLWQDPEQLDAHVSLQLRSQAVLHDVRHELSHPPLHDLEHSPLQPIAEQLPEQFPKQGQSSVLELAANKLIGFDAISIPKIGNTAFRVILKNERRFTNLSSI